MKKRWIERIDNEKRRGRIAEKNKYEKKKTGEEIRIGKKEKDDKGEAREE